MPRVYKLSALHRRMNAPQAAPTPVEVPHIGTDFESMSVNELEAYAEAHDIDLTGARRSRATRIARIVAGA